MTQLELFPPAPGFEQLALPLTYPQPKGPTPMINPLRVFAASAIGALLTLPTVAALTLMVTR